MTVLKGVGLKPNLLLTYTKPGQKTRNPTTGNWEFTEGESIEINCYATAKTFNRLDVSSDVLYSQGGGDGNKRDLAKVYLLDPPTLPAGLKLPAKLPAVLKLPSGDLVGSFELRIGKPNQILPGVNVADLIGQSVEGYFINGVQAGA